MLVFTMTIPDEGVTALCGKFGYSISVNDSLSPYFKMSPEDFVQANIEKKIDQEILKYNTDAAVFAARNSVPSSPQVSTN